MIYFAYGRCELTAFINIFVLSESSWKLSKCLQSICVEYVCFCCCSWVMLFRLYWSFYTSSILFIMVPQLPTFSTHHFHFRSGVLNIEYLIFWYRWITLFFYVSRKMWCRAGVLVDIFTFHFSVFISCSVARPNLKRRWSRDVYSTRNKTTNVNCSISITYFDKT